MRSTLARSRVIHFIAGSFSLRLPAGGAPEAAVATGTLACGGVCRLPSRHSPTRNVIDGTLMYHLLHRNRHYHHVARTAIRLHKKWFSGSSRAKTYGKDLECPLRTV